MGKLKEDAFEDLMGMLEDDVPDSDPAFVPPKKHWSPELGPTQQKIFDCASRYILAYGNRGGGKSFIFGHKLVRHLYENENALALIVVGKRSQATEGGIWDKLESEILPVWTKNLGVKYTESKRTEQQYRYRYVQNCEGKWSRLILMSMPWAVQVAGSVKGIEPSIVFVDELTSLEDPVYFDAIVQQVGRRPGVRGVQQYMAACNPEGPRHWVYKRFFEIPFEETKDIDGKIVNKAGEWNPDYAVFHLQMEENKKYLNKHYYQTVVDATRSDPVEFKRLVGGEWVDRPSGQSLFGNYFFPQIHVKGKKDSRIVPSTNFPVIVGYDIGQVNHGVSFMQAIPMKSKGVVWVIFDEMVYTNVRVEIRDLVKELMRRLDFWNKQTNHVFTHLHISDNSAFNQFRNTTGSYDHLDVERISRHYCEVYPDLKPVSMRPAPKFQGSREARVRLLISLLQEERFLVSYACSHHRDMLINLRSEGSPSGVYDPGAGFRPKRSVYIHCFDSCTYPMLEADVGVLQVSPLSHQKKTEFIDIGVGNR